LYGFGEPHGQSPDESLANLPVGVDHFGWGFGDPDSRFVEGVISLHNASNLISIPLDMGDPSFDALFGDLPDGSAISDPLPWVGGIGTQLSLKVAGVWVPQTVPTVTAIDPRYAYWITVVGSHDVPVAGFLRNLQYQVTDTLGPATYNPVSYAGTQPLSVEDVFPAATTAITGIIGEGAAATINAGVWQGSLTHFELFHGYVMESSADFSFSYDAPDEYLFDGQEIEWGFGEPPMLSEVAILWLSSREMPDDGGEIVELLSSWPEIGPWKVRCIQSFTGQIFPKPTAPLPFCNSPIPGLAERCYTSIVEENVGGLLVPIPGPSLRFVLPILPPGKYDIELIPLAGVPVISLPAALEVVWRNRSSQVYRLRNRVPMTYNNGQRTIKYEALLGFDDESTTEVT
jgi:hypothetical protein